MKKKSALFLLSLPLLILILLGLTTTCLSGCSPVYVTQAAIEEAKILLRREPISEVIQDKETSPEIRAKLELVLKARDFAEKIGLTAKQSFTQYTHTDKQELAWILLAAKVDAFEPYTWWYPIVGTVPYKGFFSKESAECDINRLQARGYETWIRGTEAFSTLGWFNDPLLTTTLRHPPHAVTNTVLHEIFHQTVWIPGSVDFNESLANAVGGLANIDFYKALLAECANEECKDFLGKNLEAAFKEWEFEKDLGKTLAKLKLELETVYGSDLPRAEKLRLRERVFKEQTALFTQKYPKSSVFSEMNNAALMQLLLYRRELELFEGLYSRCNSDWGCFITHVKKLEADSAEDPFAALSNRFMTIK